MDKLDFKKTDRAFYSGKPGRWDRLRLPAMSFLALDGQGDPNGPGFAAAIAALYPMAYGVKFACKAVGQDFVVPPLEALWWADDMAAFSANDRANWQWRVMIRMPEAVDATLLEAVRGDVLAKQARKKDGAAPELLAQTRLELLEEGEVLQTLFVGAYADEAPVLADLHARILPEAGLEPAGHHHEIYLSDPRRVAPGKLRTILRQPLQARAR